MLVNLNIALNKISILKEILDSNSPLLTTIAKNNQKFGFVFESEEIVLILDSGQEDMSKVQPIQILETNFGSFYHLSTPFLVSKEKITILDITSTTMLIESFEEEVKLLSELNQQVMFTKKKFEDILSSRKNIYAKTDLSTDDLLDLFNYAKSKNLTDWQKEITDKLYIKSKETV